MRARELSPSAPRDVAVPSVSLTNPSGPHDEHFCVSDFLERVCAVRLDHGSKARGRRRRRSSAACGGRHREAEGRGHRGEEATGQERRDCKPAPESVRGAQWKGERVEGRSVKSRRWSPSPGCFLLYLSSTRR